MPELSAVSTNRTRRVFCGCRMHDIGFAEIRARHEIEGCNTLPWQSANVFERLVEIAHIQ